MSQGLLANQKPNVWIDNQVLSDETKKRLLPFQFLTSSLPTIQSKQYMVYGQNKFVLTDGVDILTSLNGVDWKEYPNKNIGGNGLAFGNNTFVTYDNSNRMAYSSNGIDWTYATQNPHTLLFPIGRLLFAEGRFIAVGNLGGNRKRAYCAFSDDNGKTWKTSQPFDVNGDITGVAYKNRRLIALDNSGGTFYSDNLGEKWNVGKKINTTSTVNNAFNSITADKSRFVVLYSPSIFFISEDGSNWQEERFPKPFEIATIYNENNIWIALSNSAKKCWYSYDFKKWQICYSEYVIQPNAQAFSSNQFVVTSNTQSHALNFPTQDEIQQITPDDAFNLLLDRIDLASVTK